MSEGASIHAVCHSQIKRKVVEALDVSSTATNVHAGCCMSVGEPAYYFKLEGVSKNRRKRSFLAHVKKESRREQNTRARAAAEEPEVQFSSQGSWTCTR